VEESDLVISFEGTEGQESEFFPPFSYEQKSTISSSMHHHSIARHMPTKYIEGLKTSASNVIAASLLQHSKLMNLISKLIVSHKSSCGVHSTVSTAQHSRPTLPSLAETDELTQSCRAESAWNWKMLWDGDYAASLRGDSLEPSGRRAVAEAWGPAGRGRFVDGFWVRVAVWWLGIRLRICCLGWALILRLSCSANPVMLSVGRLPSRRGAHAWPGRGSALSRALSGCGVRRRVGGRWLWRAEELGGEEEEEGSRYQVGGVGWFEEGGCEFGCGGEG
jgi:hypothetical protein